MDKLKHIYDVLKEHVILINHLVGVDLWPILWDLKAPNVFKEFMWRALKSLKT
jgi:hypothetical protein